MGIDGSHDEAKSPAEGPVKGSRRPVKKVAKVTAAKKAPAVRKRKAAARPSPKQSERALARSDTKANSEAELFERRAKEFELRKAGASLKQIADRFGVSMVTVHKDIEWCFQQLLPAEDIAEMRAMEVARIDTLRLGLWRQASTGDIAAIDCWIRLSARMAKLVGLDAPVKLAGHDGGALPVQSVSLQVLAEVVKHALDDGALLDVIDVEPIESLEDSILGLRRFRPTSC